MATSWRRGFVAVFVIALSVMLLVPATMADDFNFVELRKDEQWVQGLGNLSKEEVTTITFTILVKEEDVVDVEIRDKDDNLLRLRNDVKDDKLVFYIEPGEGADRLIVKRVDTDYATIFSWELDVWDPSRWVQDEGYVPTWWEENTLPVLAVVGIVGAVALTAAAFAGPSTELSPGSRLQAGFLRIFRWR